MLNYAYSCPRCHARTHSSVISADILCAAHSDRVYMRLERMLEEPTLGPDELRKHIDDETAKLRNQIRAQLRRKRLARVDVARQLGVSIGDVNRWLSSHQPLDLQALIAMAWIADCRVRMELCRL